VHYLLTNDLLSRLAESVKILIAVAIFGTHPLQCYVVIDIIWNTYLAPLFVKNSRVLIIEMAVRTLIVTISCKFSRRNRKESSRAASESLFVT